MQRIEMKVVILLLGALCAFVAGQTDFVDDPEAELRK